MHTGPSPWVPRPAQLCDPIGSPFMCTCAAVGRSSLVSLGGNDQQGPWPICDIFSTCRNLCPSCLFRNPTPSSPFTDSQNKVQTPHPLSRSCSWGVFSHLSIRALSTRLVTLPASHPLLLHPPATRPRVQSTRAALSRYYGTAVIVTSLIPATYSSRKRLIPTPARCYYAHLPFFRLTSTHLASMIYIGFLD